MEEKKIEVTEKDFIKATGSMCVEDEGTRKLIHDLPMMTLLIPIITSNLWDELVKMKEENENGEAE